MVGERRDGKLPNGASMMITSIGGSLLLPVRYTTVYVYSTQIQVNSLDGGRENVKRCTPFVGRPSNASVLVLLGRGVGRSLVWGEGALIFRLFLPMFKVKSAILRPRNAILSKKFRVRL